MQNENFHKFFIPIPLLLKTILTFPFSPNN